MAASNTGTDHVMGVRHRTVAVDGLEIFYREAGPDGGPTLLLLHGFPAASHQYAHLMDRLSDRIHLIAPDYPRFGYSRAPASSNGGRDFVHSFDHIAEVIEAFLVALGIDAFFMYVFDFGEVTRTGSPQFLCEDQLHDDVLHCTASFRCWSIGSSTTRFGGALLRGVSDGALRVSTLRDVKITPATTRRRHYPRRADRRAHQHALPRSAGISTEKLPGESALNAPLQVVS